jgi:hypothetical protein
MLLGVSWPWWVLTAVAAYGVVRVGALVAATAAEVRDPAAAAPLAGGWFCPDIVALPVRWILLGGVAAGAAGYAVVGGWVFPDDPDLKRSFGIAAAIVGFLIGALGEVRLALWSRRWLVPRVLARDFSTTLEALQLGEAAERLRAAQRLSRMGPRAAPAIHDLASVARRDDSADVRVAAAEALANLAVAGVPLPPDHPAALLQDPDVRVRAVAACSAVRLDTRDARNPPSIEPTAQQLSVLGEAVQLPDDVAGPEGVGLAETATRALAALGTLAEPAVPALRAAVCDREPPNLHAIDALTKVGPAAVPALVEMLVHEEAAVRREAADMLGLMGKDAARAIPALREMLVAFPEDADWAEFAIELIESAG